MTLFTDTLMDHVIIVLFLALPASLGHEDGFVYKNLTKSEFVRNFKELDLVNQNVLKERLGDSSCLFNSSITRFNLTTPEILKSNGIGMETHYVTSSDGYIIEIHRIPKPGKPVIYLVPGIFQSSRDFLVGCPGRSLGIKLADAGYDLWLGNFRGNAYGRNHTKLVVDTQSFYDFAIDDIAAYDIPAGIDYILNNTGQPKLSYIGYSMGSTVLLGLLSSQPQYNDKVHLAIIMAPAIYVKSVKSPLGVLMARYRNFFDRVMTKYWRSQVTPPRLMAFIQSIVPKICLREARANRFGVCSLILGIVDGPDPLQFNSANAPFLLAGLPSTTSAHVVSQFLQWIGTGRFAKFDFGPMKNSLKYLKEEPPVYNLTNVRVPIINFWAENDYFVAKKDVFKAMKMLPNVLANVRVNWTKWNHIDYLYAKDADILVYDFILHALGLSYGGATQENLIDHS